VEVPDLLPAASPIRDARVAASSGDVGGTSNMSGRRISFAMMRRESGPIFGTVARTRDGSRGSSSNRSLPRFQYTH
jgi:hypothetical protein